ncbi:MAG: hypothetical protein ABSD75_18340 [Terriglobales bacterium]|jgi:hypothetical protein
MHTKQECGHLGGSTTSARETPEQRRARGLRARSTFLRRTEERLRDDPRARAIEEKLLERVAQLTGNVLR